MLHLFLFRNIETQRTRVGPSDSDSYDPDSPGPQGAWRSPATAVMQWVGSLNAELAREVSHRRPA
jgi:hypothetical protein